MSSDSDPPPALPLRLDEARIRRYGRQILLDAVGGIGQRALLAGAVAVPLDGDDEQRAAALVAIAYLAGAGVGGIELGGRWETPVEAAELGMLLEGSDLGQPRGPAIARRIAERNPDVRVVPAGTLAGAVPLQLEERDPRAAGAPELAAGDDAAGRGGRALWRGGRAATAAIAALLASHG